MLDIEFSCGVQPVLPIDVLTDRRRHPDRVAASCELSAIGSIPAARPAAVSVDLSVGERLDLAPVLGLNKRVDVLHILAALLLGYPAKNGETMIHARADFMNRTIGDATYPMLRNPPNAKLGIRAGC